MASAGEASKKRNSFSMLSWKEPCTSSRPNTDDAKPANGRFIPESKRGWKYDIPHASAAPPISRIVLTTSSSTTNSIRSQAGSKSGSRSSRDMLDQRPNTTASSSMQDGGLVSFDALSTRPSREALSVPVSPKQRFGMTRLSAPQMIPSDSSSSEDELVMNPPEVDQRPTPLEASANGVDPEYHPDDLIYPDAYPWKPSHSNPKAKYIHPAHRNPTAKQAFYDTHFGSSSNYRGLLPSSGSLLSLNHNKPDTGRRSSDKGGASKGNVADVDEEVHSTGIASTIKKPFATASKLLTKARRKSGDNNASCFVVSADDETNTAASSASYQANLHRPNPNPDPAPLYGGGGEELAAQLSGFSYGLSMEDAAQVEAVVSRQASQEDLNSAVQHDLLESPSHEHSSSRWKEALHSAWGFLPSFDFLASSTAPTDGSNQVKSLTLANIFEPEAIPSVKKDAGNPDYFKNLSGNVVLMGGYRGSVLRDAETNMMMWIPIKVGVGLRRPTLELGLSTEAEENSEDLVYSSEMVTHIGKIVDMGKRLEDRIASRRHAKVFSWGYDWRLSLARSSRRLIDFLEELYKASVDEATGYRRGAKVVAHSMGGLVALHALATCNNPRIFEGIVFASTPFCGTPNILGPFRFGDAALFNDTICSPRATFSFRSSFYLLPTDGRCFEIPVGESGQDEEDLTDQQRRGRFKDVDFLDPDVWNDLGFSPCVQVGRRQQMIALARKTPSGQSTGGIFATDANDKFSLEKEATHAVRSNSAIANSGLDIPSPQGDENAKPNGLTMGIMEGLTDGTNPIPNQAELGATDEEQELLQPENRQGAQRNLPNNCMQTDFDRLDYPTQSWLYLDRTLAEVRQFWEDIDKGLDRAKVEDGSYPPLMLMVSGRTPCVRGALVGVDQAHSAQDSTGEKGWKDDVRAGGFSRMTYAAGDGVITRHSATTLPGVWSTLLTKRSEAESLPSHLHGQGPPFGTNPKSPSKARLKLDRYKMHFDGQGIVESAHRHVTLLSDIDGIGKCLEAVRRANLVRGRIPLTPHGSD